MKFEQSDLAKFGRSPTYDYLMRLPLSAWSLLLAVVTVSGLVTYVHHANHISNGVLAINIAMRVATIAFLIVLASATIARARPIGKARGIEPRISALLGTMLPTAIVLFPRYELSATAEVISTVLILLGNALSVFVLSQLGRAFSVMAEARQLVASGIYRYLRHPLYLAEEIAVLGIYMQFWSLWTTLLLIVHGAFQVRRMNNEEKFLSEAFADYLRYRKRTKRLIPGVY